MLLISGASVDEITSLIKEIENEEKLMLFSTIEATDIEPKIISRLPNLDRKDYSFPSSLNDLVFIEGFKISKTQNKPSFSPFVLTDTKGGK